MSAASSDRGPHGTRPSPFTPGTFRPAPGRGPLGRMLAVQVRTETLLALRQAEQALLTLVIPLVVLVGLTLVPGVVALPEPRVATLLGSVLALGVMSTGFTSQAIALGFDRRYGVLRRLGASGVPRWLVVCGRLGASGSVVGLQLVVFGVVAGLLGWRPGIVDVGWALLLVLAGTAAFGALGLLLGGTLRAELVLGVANLVWFVLLLAGGILVPADSLPGPLPLVVELLPSGALAEGLRTALAGGTPPVWPFVVLLVWAGVAGVAAARTVRWR